jgi:predicted nucleotide-binding protein (sugar kinase/HSP70/actin superfamily)
MGQIPVKSVNLAGLEKNSGFKITLPVLRKALAAVVYGDMLMLLSNQTKPYEVNKGESEALVDHG